eukprot:TRINITY_DN2749_c0_g1_i10.p1 TRINITY_DN2749_c0_g1~~TRINITY_DN2749_c0_g1_i10.p1  ORF type:complete len:269 (-),score=37.68 TRINITY_DN2749_c0_g1_i10:172-936(-)
MKDENTSGRKGPAFLVAADDPTKNSVTNTISLFIDENKQYIQYGFYTLGAIGIIKMGHSVRAFSRFSRASDIPDQFFRDRVQIYVRVKSADISAYKSENVPKLTVSHIPIIQTPFTKNSELNQNLSLLLPGLHIHPEYLEKARELLSKETSAKKLKVCLLERHENDAIVEARIVNRLRRNTVVGTSLLYEGFGKISGNCGLMSSNYLNVLQRSEDKARRWKRGIWEAKTQGSPAALYKSYSSRLLAYLKSFVKW